MSDTCTICGLQFTEPSMGGPGICPMWDCGIQPTAHQKAMIESLRRKLSTAQSRVRKLERELENERRCFSVIRRLVSEELQRAKEPGDG